MLAVRGALGGGCSFSRVWYIAQSNMMSIGFPASLNGTRSLFYARTSGPRTKG